jgi:hypothetical protein
MGLVILGSWQRRERKYSGGEGALTRVVEGGGHFCFFFFETNTPCEERSNIPKICKLNLNQLHFITE